MSHSYARDIVGLQIVVLIWQTYWMVRSVHALARGDRRTILFVQLVFYFFFAVPGLLDLVIGAPAYTYQRGFVMSQFDHTTNLIYLLYVAVVPVVFEIVGGRPSATLGAVTSMRLGRTARLIAWAALLGLPLVLAMAPRPMEYLHYARFIAHQIEGADQYNVFVVLWATLVVISAVLIISAEGSLAIERAAATPFLMIAIWVHGKRSIVAVALFLILYILWMRGALRGRRFIGALLVVGLVLGTFSRVYQNNVREIGENSRIRERGFESSEDYVNYRIDYGRDGVGKQTIYAELHPDEIRILEYRGQSLLFDLAILVPRSVWPGKPYPYPTYVTSAMFGFDPTDMGWGVTTSWLEEAIANLSWFGLIAGPVVPALICRIGDRRRSMLVGILTVTIGSFLLVLSLVAFFPMFALWVILNVRRQR